MNAFLNTIHKVADSIYKILTPSEEEARRLAKRYTAMYTIYDEDSK